MAQGTVAEAAESPRRSSESGAQAAIAKLTETTLRAKKEEKTTTLQRIVRARTRSGLWRLKIVAAKKKKKKAMT